MSEQGGSQNIVHLNPEQVSLNQAKKDSVDISFEQLTYSVTQKDKTQREILSGITGVLQAGQVNCIMGASGAGKTSLLNILACRVKSSSLVSLSGKVQANGRDYSQDNFNDFSAYVMQTDVLFATMTPRECLMFAANLKFIGTAKEKEEKVNQILQQFKLEKCCDTIVGGLTLKGISGGERKRTSIATELITNPQVLMLDEPTSGLDSFTSFLIIKVLRDYARLGKTVIFTIHQPNADIYSLFDRLVLLVEGQLIYQGPRQGAIDHFSSIGYACPPQSNPTDYFMEIMHSNYQPEQKNSRYALFFDNYQRKQYPAVQQALQDKSTNPFPERSKVNSFLYEVKVIASRTILNQKRNPILFKGRIGQSIFLGLLCSIVYLGQAKEDPFNIRSIQNISGALFFLTTNMFMGSFQPVILTFSEERMVFLKEVNGRLYGVMSYFFGKTIPELFIQILAPVIMGILTYFIIGFNQDSHEQPLIFFLIVIVLSISGGSMGLALGTAIPDQKVSLSVAPLIFIPMMLFSGFYANANSLASWIEWVQYISPFKHGLQALIINQFENKHLIYSPVDKFAMTQGLWNSLLYLFLLGLVCRLLALLFLKLSVRNLQ